MKEKERWSPPAHWGKRHSRHWGGPSSRRSWVFLWFAAIFGFMGLLAFLALAALAVLFFSSNQFGHSRASVFWLLGCGFSVLLPLLIIGLAMRAFRGVAAPLVDLMQAADAVAAGDLTVRVAEQKESRGFGQLTRSFNRMLAELAQADRQRRNLTADVAHELRTPLHIIQGNLEGILDGVYAADTAHIEATLDETRLLARLVNDLHTLSQAEADQLPLRRERVALTDLMADLQTSFSGMAAAAEIELTVENEAGATAVNGDPGRLDQIMSNLLVNALRHTPAGGQIWLSAKVVDGQVKLAVRDNGEGIPAEDLPYIFDRFWRGDRSRSHRDGSGGGLGLAIARQLVRAHEGRIEVTSDEGQGTTFTVQLAVAEES